MHSWPQPRCAPEAIICTDALANLLSERRKRGVAVHARRARPGKLNARFAKPGTQVRFHMNERLTLPPNAVLQAG